MLKQMFLQNGEAELLSKQTDDSKCGITLLGIIGFPIPISNNNQKEIQLFCTIQDISDIQFTYLYT